MRIGDDAILEPVLYRTNRRRQDIITKPDDTIYAVAAGVYTKKINQAFEVTVTWGKNCLLDYYDVFSPAPPFGD
uniref:Restriction endonuclease subunit S n=1 Tax=Rhabditophanes sp. KR3021 TaxID=114890 RepID=A0AC35UA94_9BILA